MQNDNGIDLEEATHVEVRMKDQDENEVFANYKTVGLTFLEDQTKDFDLNALDPVTYQPTYISDYEITFEVQVINDSAPDDNVDTLSLSVTDSVYARDNGIDGFGTGVNFGVTL